MPIVRGNWPDYVRPLARKAFRDDYPEMPKKYESIFNVMTTDRAFFEDLVSTGLGTVGLKPEAQDVPMDEPVHRGKVKYVVLTYGLGYEASEEMVEDDLYKIVVPKASKDLARSMRDAEERIAASVLNLAFTTQQAYDGVSLINTAHTTGTAATQSNRPATDIDLSLAGLQAALEHFMDMENDRGLKITIDPKMVVVHPSNFWLIHEILGSEFVPFTADNTKNILAMQGLTSFIYPYLTDEDSWFVLADKGTHKLNFVWRRRTSMRDSFDERAGVMFNMVTARFTAGASEWRGMYGSTGS